MYMYMYMYVYIYMYINMYTYIFIYASTLAHQKCGDLFGLMSRIQGIIPTQ